MARPEPAVTGTPAPRVEAAIAEAIARIRFGSVVVQIQDGVVVQIESTEKRRFDSPPSRSSAS